MVKQFLKNLVSEYKTLLKEYKTLKLEEELRKLNQDFWNSLLPGYTEDTSDSIYIIRERDSDSNEITVYKDDDRRLFISIQDCSCSLYLKVAELAEEVEHLNLSLYCTKLLESLNAKTQEGDFIALVDESTLEKGKPIIAFFYRRTLKDLTLDEFLKVLNRYIDTEYKPSTEIFIQYHNILLDHRSTLEEFEVEETGQ